MTIYGFDDHAITWLKSYLSNRTQAVHIKGQSSSTQEINLGTPQGSRISPLLFICLMADLDLWTDQCSLSQYADDTQSLCIAEDRDKAVEMTRNEANNVIDFFTANDLKNNAKKSCVVYNSRGQGKTLTLEDVGGVNHTSLKDGE